MKIKATTFSFDAKNEPVCHAKDGDVLTFVTRDCYDNQLLLEESEVKIDWDRTNPATGPVYIDGAEKGDAVIVDIIDVKVGDTAVAVALPDCGPKGIKTGSEKAFFKVEGKNLIWEGKDISFPLDPMVGVIGLADEEPISTGYVGRHGGNMDSQIIKKGASVWLPVRIKGGLLSMGDIHGVMADGEMAGNGAEMKGEITVRIRLKKNCDINYPITETKNYYFVNTYGPTCDTAIERGYTEMHRLIKRGYNLNDTEAAIYMSLQGKLESNQSCLTPGAGGNTFRTGTPKVEGKSIL